MLLVISCDDQLGLGDLIIKNIDLRLGFGKHLAARRVAVFQFLEGRPVLLDLLPIPFDLQSVIGFVAHQKFLRHDKSHRGDSIPETRRPADPFPNRFARLLFLQSVGSISCQPRRKSGLFIANSGPSILLALGLLQVLSIGYVRRGRVLQIPRRKALSISKKRRRTSGFVAKSRVAL